MLTKTDFTQIRKIVREEIETESQNLKDELQSDIKMSQIRILGEISKLQNRTKNIEIKINSI